MRTGSRVHRRGAVRLLAAALAILALAAEAAAQGVGTVRGQIRAEDTGELFSGAIVELVGLPAHVAMTDESGRYALRDVPAGRRILRASHLGRAPFEIEVTVPAGGTVTVDLSLGLRPVALAPVRVDGSRDRAATDTVGATPSELGMAGARAMGSSPGFAELGMADAVQQVPRQEPPDPSSVLYVRGAGADLKLVYLDGAPVYAPFPLGGLIDAFAPGALGSADVFRGGAPARYDGGLSYVMDLRTRAVRTERPHTTGALDLLSARASVEAPIAPGLGVMASARTVHGAGTVDPLPYGYHEALLRTDIALPTGGAIRFTGFLNDESVLLDHDAPTSAVMWGNSAASVRISGRVRASDAEVTMAVGRYDARLPLSADTGHLDGAASRARLAADLKAERAGMTFRYGLSLDRLTHGYRAELRDGALVAADVVGNSVGAYIDTSWRPASRMTVRGGWRVDHFGYGSKLVMAPRLAITYLATDRVALTVAGGRYHQYVRAPESQVLFPQADVSGTAVTAAPLTVGAASHLSASLDQEIGEGMRLGVEGFFKSFEGVPIQDSDRGNSSGVDLWLRRDRGRITGWAGYSLAWVWSGGGGSEGDRFAGRHLLTAGIGTPVTSRARLDASFSYGSGLPYAAIPLANAPVMEATAEGAAPRTALFNTASEVAPLLPTPDRPYLRLDLSASHAWNGRWAGRDLRVASYLKLLNTLDQRDALFYQYRPGEELRALAAIPIVPVLGVEWTF